MGTLKHPACTVGWVARLNRSWLSPGKQPEFPMGEIPLEQRRCKKNKRMLALSIELACHDAGPFPVDSVCAFVITWADCDQIW